MEPNLKISQTQLNAAFYLKENINRTIESYQTMLHSEVIADSFSKAVRVMVNAYQKGGRVYVAGNGGSAADAQHFSAELVAKLGVMRPAIAAESLTVDTSAITAIANDFGYDFIFSRQLEAKLTEHDVFFAITTSGNSKNILEALRVCQQKKIPTILLTGPLGGSAKALCDIVIQCPGNDASHIQESHVVIYHSLCSLIEKELFFQSK